jgi:integrase
MAAAEGVIPTVGSVVRDYINERDEREAERRGRKVRSDASHRLSRYVIGQDARGKQPAIAPAKLASVTLPALTDDDLLKWREGLPATLSASSKQRLINDLRAALNAAYERHRKSLDAVLPTTIRYGLKKKKGGSRKGAKAVVRENQILTDAQVVQVLRIAQEVDAEEGWEGDLYRMAVVLAATGARLAQAKRMRVCDYQRDKGRLMVPRSYKGNGEKDDDIPVPVGEDALAALLPAVTGRPKDATLLERWRKKQAPGEIRWVRDGRGAWQTASEFDRPWREIRKRAKLAASIVPYSLRHTSIVRGLRANLPVELVAKLHDTSSEMIRTNYARFIAHGLEELAARAIVPLLPKDDGKVVALR